MRRVNAIPLVLALGLAAGAAHAQQVKDGIHLKSSKDDCPCGGQHLSECPCDGLWCPPWCPPIEPVPETKRPVSVVAKIVPLRFRVYTESPPPGEPLSDPVITKGAAKAGGPFFDGDPGDLDDGDTSLIWGPELAVPLKEDVTEWEVGSWLPQGSSLGFYARVLFGELEIFGVGDIDLELYSVGLRLTVPLVHPSEFALGAYVAAGPAFLRTDVGDALGFDAGVGLEAGYGLSQSVTLVGAVELNAFVSENVFAYGPAFTFGLIVGF